MERQKVYLGSKVQGLSPEWLAMELEFDVFAVPDPRLFLFTNSTSGSFISLYSGFLGFHFWKDGWVAVCSHQYHGRPPWELEPMKSGFELWIGTAFWCCALLWIQSISHKLKSWSPVQCSENEKWLDCGIWVGLLTYSTCWYADEFTIWGCFFFLFVCLRTSTLEEWVHLRGGLEVFVFSIIPSCSLGLSLCFLAAMG